MRLAHPQGLELANAQGDPRGYVDPAPRLDDLWIMQGSVCDLKCKHCYTASSPTNHRLEQITLAELEPHLVAAASRGVRQIYFTGGEVFVNEEVLRGQAARNEDFLACLEAAARVAPVEILTNGRRYIRAHYEALVKLKDRVRLRFTLESPRAEDHDRIRGRGTFAQTVETVKQFGRAGFTPVITAERPLLAPAADDQIRAQYQALFPGLPIEVNLIENLLEMGHRLHQIGAPQPPVFVTTKCFAILNKPPESLMCYSSRCLQKIEGRLRYYPCPVIYDDARFELGATLEESLRRVYLAHKNCYDYCMKGAGASCRTTAI